MSQLPPYNEPVLGDGWVPDHDAHHVQGQGTKALCPHQRAQRRDHLPPFVSQFMTTHYHHVALCGGAAVYTVIGGAAELPCPIASCHTGQKQWRDPTSVTLCFFHLAEKAFCQGVPDAVVQTRLLVTKLHPDREKEYSSAADIPFGDVDLFVRLRDAAAVQSVARSLKAIPPAAVSQIAFLGNTVTMRFQDWPTMPVQLVFAEHQTFRGIVSAFDFTHVGFTLSITSNGTVIVSSSTNDGRSFLSLGSGFCRLDAPPLERLAKWKRRVRFVARPDGHRPPRRPDATKYYPDGDLTSFDGVMFGVREYRAFMVLPQTSVQQLLPEFRNRELHLAVEAGKTAPAERNTVDTAVAVRQYQAQTAARQTAPGFPTSRFGQDPDTHERRLQYLSKWVDWTFVGPPRMRNMWVRPNEEEIAVCWALMRTTFKYWEDRSNLYVDEAIEEWWNQFP
jgi:hypothetical protein